ncbi:MAG: gamma-glutamyl-gamma-aminobutyrate hydrolase family protein [Lentisphaerota bacterium]
MKKSLKIGLSAGLYSGEIERPIEKGRAYVSNDYVQSVARSGAIPIIFPIISDSSQIEQMMELVDGLILTGGDDINPLLYGEEPHIKLRNVIPQRDIFEYELLKYAQKRKTPVLGICRGHQLINTFFGGSLYQDNSLKESSYIRHSQSKGNDFLEHTVNIKKDSWIHSFLGNKILTNSYHHQSIKNLADGFTISAESMDGIVEAIEKLGEGFFCVGIQWHPEMMSDKNQPMQNIFNEFSKVCAKNIASVIFTPYCSTFMEI